MYFGPALGFEILEPPQLIHPEKPLVGAGHRFHVHRHKVLFSEGDPATSVYRVITGAVRAVKSLPDGRRHIVKFVLPGEVMGLDCISAYAYSAEAVVDTFLASSERRSMMKPLTYNPAVAKKMVEHVSQQIAAAYDQMLVLARLDATEKIASFVLDLAQRSGHTRLDYCLLYLAMTRADIADYLGLTLESVSRTFHQLKRDQTIDLPCRQQIYILNAERLVTLANGQSNAQAE